MASDLELAGNTQSGFFVADLRDLTAGQFTDWAVPGLKYRAVRFNEGTSGAITIATTEWEGFSRALRFRIRLFQECQIKKKLAVEVYCLYASFIPQLSEVAIKAINTANFRYLGQTWTGAKSAFANDVVWAQFWPGGKMDTVIFGYEGDSV